MGLFERNQPIDQPSSLGFAWSFAATKAVAGRARRARATSKDRAREPDRLATPPVRLEPFIPEKEPMLATKAA
jgi:hypothetical protein